MEEALVASQEPEPPDGFERKVPTVKAHVLDAREELQRERDYEEPQSRVPQLDAEV